MRRAAAISDLRAIAKRRLPKVVFDYLEGGAGQEACLERNRRAFDDHALVPRYLVDVTARQRSASVFGAEYAAPFGLAPIGLANLIWPRAEQIAAAVAAEKNLPFVLSTASATPLEEITAIGGRNIWFQLYPSSKKEITRDLIRRAEATGCEVLVVTVDLPAPAKRNRDQRNGFGLPLRLGLNNTLEFARHLRWVLGLLRDGTPTFANLEPYAETERGVQSLAAFMASQISGAFDWRELEALRQQWRGRLLVKGILHPEDARMAAERDVDGIVVSNHGGRQLECAPATMEMVSRIREAAGDALTILLDGGIRSGVDIAKALAAGADFTLCGRAWLYGVAAGGARGLAHAVEVLDSELDATLAQIGCRRLEELSTEYLLDLA